MTWAGRLVYSLMLDTNAQECLLADFTSPDNSDLDGVLPPHFTRNAIAFIADYAFFLFAMGFIGTGTVMPGLVAALTPHSEIYVGLLNALVSGLWLLPQMVIAGAVTRLPYKKPFIVLAALISRPVMLLTAAVVQLCGRSQPDLALLAVLVSFSIFFVGDAVASVPWFDVLSRTIPHRRRGRVMGAAQVLGGIMGIASGLGVRYVLSPGSPWAFPTNYAALFIISSIAMAGSTIALACLREPEPAVVDHSVPTARDVLAMLPRILVRDRPFLQLNITRLLYGFASVASAFYVLYATRHQGFSIEATGLFVSASVVGSLTSGLLMGAMQDRLGPLAHMRLSIVVAAMSPLLALATGPLFAGLGTGVLLPLYLLLYFFLGISGGSMSWPFFNWIMEYTTESWRPLYIGMLNTLGAITMLAPVLGGWIASTFSYPAVFWLALIFAGMAMLSSLPLLDPRKKKVEAAEPAGSAVN